MGLKSIAPYRNDYIFFDSSKNCPGGISIKTLCRVPCILPRGVTLYLYLSETVLFTKNPQSRSGILVRQGFLPKRLTNSCLIHPSSTSSVCPAVISPSSYCRLSRYFDAHVTVRSVGGLGFDRAGFRDPGKVKNPACFVSEIASAEEFDRDQEDGRSSARKALQP